MKTRLLTALLSALALQFLVLTPLTLRTASAACFVGWSACGGGDNTRTSSLSVYHVTGAMALTPVSPDDTDVWDVTAYYSPKPGNPCNDVTYTATITVTNAGAGWAVACAGCGAVPYTQVQVCDISTCSSSNPDAYTIALDMTVFVAGYEITRVTYSSASLDDGDELNGLCNTVGTVSPTSQSWSTNDTTFPCSYDCSSDATIVITYN